jgi:hypothetical protein
LPRSLEHQVESDGDGGVVVTSGQTTSLLLGHFNGSIRVMARGGHFLTTCLSRNLVVTMFVCTHDSFV